jgi:uncharacterized protein
MHLKIEIRDCSIGKGLFALALIHPGELIFYVNGPLVGFEECLRLDNQGDHAIQVGHNLYVDSGFPARFINHSCDPNAGICDGQRIIAIRTIRPGEQVSFDYSTCMLERHWEMECRCGAPACRGVVRDFDALPRALQARYIGLGVVQPFILEHLVAAPVATPARTPPRRDRPGPPPIAPARRRPAEHAVI